MYISNVKTQYKTFRKQRLCQGDIFKDVLVSIGAGDNSVHTEIPIDYAVVVSQDCDLQQDFDERNDKNRKNEDKHIETILLCPAYTVDKFLTGNHIPNRTMEIITGKNLKKIKTNDTFKRYHYLQQDLDNAVPELVVDFKHFLTASRYQLYKSRKTAYVTTVNEIYREALSQRFVNFLGRIGLPDNSSS